MLSAYAMGYGTCCIGSAVPVLNLTAVKRGYNEVFEIPREVMNGEGAAVEEAATAQA